MTDEFQTMTPPPTPVPNKDTMTEKEFSDAADKKQVWDNTHVEEETVLTGQILEAIDEMTALKLATEAAKSESETARDRADEWANKSENSEVEAGKFSAFHHSEKSRRWAEEDEEVEAGKFSAKHHSEKSRKWAEEDEDAEVEAGQYSAKHFSLKAAQYLTALTSGVDAAAYDGPLSLEHGDEAIVISTGKSFVASQWIAIVSKNNLGLWKMGYVNAYDPNTGALHYTISACNGEGADDEWLISTCAPPIQEIPSFSNKSGQVLTNNGEQVRWENTGITATSIYLSTTF